MGENEMQTIVRDPNDVIVQAILIKVHQEKPKPDCKEYKLINDLLAGLEREEKSKNDQESMLKANLNKFNKDDGNQNLTQDAYMKEQMKLMAYYKAQAEKAKKKKDNI